MIYSLNKFFFNKLLLA